MKVFHKNWNARAYIPPLSQLRWKIILRILSVFFFLIALSGPYFPGWIQSFPVKGRQIYFLLDVSASMNVKDLTTSRLKYAKNIIHRLIDHFQGDEMGLIVFTDDAYVQCPLTKDFRLLKSFLDLSQTQQFSRTGTQYRNALATALDRFLSNPSPLDNGQRLVILFSDGGDFGDEYTSIVDRYRQANIFIIPIGIGTSQGDYIPAPQSSHPLKIVTDSRGQPVISSLKDQGLKTIAKAVGTAYYVFDQPSADLQPLIRQINQISLAVLDDQTAVKPFNTYQIFLLIGIVLFLTQSFWLPGKIHEKDSLHNDH